VALKPNSDQGKTNSVDTFSSRLAKENILNESNFTVGKGSGDNSVSAQAHRSFKLKIWHYLLLALLILALASLGLFVYKGLSSKKTPKGVEGASKYNTTPLDVTGLKTTQSSTAVNQLVVNGATQINGALTAVSLSGDGANVTNLNATNVTAGTLNDGRLSQNVALLNRTQTFSGNNTFSGSVNLPNSVVFGSLLFNFPPNQALGFLKNDGNGNLSWNTGGSTGCINQCVNDGGDTFGAAISVGTNDAFGMALRTGGINRLTISPTGSAIFSGSVTSPFFFGNGTGLTSLDATQLTTGTISNARLSNSVTTQGNTFNGIDQLVQLNGLGYLPTLNGGNLTSLNASFVTSGTLSDARLTTNVALLDANQLFTGNNTFSSAITVNTLTPNAAMTIGATNRDLTLRGNSSTVLTSTNAGGTVSVGFNGVSTGGVIYNFDASAAPGTYTICTTAGGGCGGGGSGTVSSPGGSTNKLAKFTGSQTIADSTITDSGSAVAISAPELRLNGAAGGYALDATGDINASQYLRVGGNIVCDSTGCSTGGGGGSGINNTTSIQTAANFFIQSAGAANPTGIIRALGGQSADLFQFQNSGGSTIAEVYNNGGINTTVGYYVNGSQIASSNLSDSANLAKLNADQTFSGNNIFSGNFISRRASDTTTAFRVQNSSSADLLVVNTLNGRVAIGATSASYPLDVTGDINSSTGLRVGGNLVCDSSGCAASGSSGFYIQNGVATQTNANFNIKTVDANNVTGVLQGATSQAVDIFQIKDSLGTNLFKVGNTGLTTINNGLSFTGGNQTIQNNTGTLNVAANSTTLALNNTTVFTSGDGTGIRYATNYSYQPLSLVTRQYVDDSISGVVAGTCPTCFINGGNSFGTSASVGTNDNNTFTIETANTSRIFLGTNGGIAMQSSTASGNYATAAGASLASGDYSFAVGGGTASGVHSFAGGYNVNPITASGNGSMAFGYSQNGAITAAGIGSFAGGNASSTDASAAYSIAYGYGANTGANAIAAAAFNYATASGNGSFATGCSTASGVESFSTGYCANYALTAAGNGSFAGGYANNGPVTASSLGSFAFGNDVRANNTSGFYSTAFGWGARANGTGSMAVNAAQTSGDYSFASGYGIASGTAALAMGYAANAYPTASGTGSFAGGYAQNYAITSAGSGSMAFGFANNGAITATGIGSFAGGNSSTTSAGGAYSIAFGYGARTQAEAAAAFNYALASGTGSTALGSSLVTSSGNYSLAGGYAGSAINSTSNGSFAFGRTQAATLNATGEGAWAGGYAISYDITASGIGALAFGSTRSGAITAAGESSFAGGNNSSTSVGGTNSIAFGDNARAQANASAAFNVALASGAGSAAFGNTTASGPYSFSGGDSLSFAVTSSGRGALAFGVARNGVITASGEGSFAGGDNSTATQSNAIAFGTGTHATGAYSAAFNNSTASNSGAFSIGSGIASGVHSFASGYATGSGGVAYATASGQGSIAGGYALSYAITSGGIGSMAFGISRNGAITTNNAEGSFAGGDNSSVGTNANYSIAFGTGTRANGVYSAAFNNSTASGTGAFSTGNAVASGSLSFATGYNTGAGAITAGGEGSFAGGFTANNFSITTANRGSMAFGYALDGSITTNNATGAFAGGDASSVGNGANYSIAYGISTQANGAYSAAFNNSTASGTGAFSSGIATTASGPGAFAAGYNTGAGAINASGYGSEAGGYTTANLSITASGHGSSAIGYTSLGSITAAGNGSFAGGDGSTTCASCHASIAYGYGALTTAGTGSVAFNTASAGNDYAFAANDGTATGQYSTAFGTLTTASGFNSTAFGRKMTVSNNYSFGVSLADASYTVADANTASFMGGYVGIGTVSPGSFGSALAVVGDGYTYGSYVGSTGTAIAVRAGDNSTGTLETFQRADGTTVGSITHNGANTAFNTSSDARLKHDITDTSLGLDTVLNLKIHDFKYNSDSSGTTYTGFIAQELQQLFPGAVSVMDPSTGYLGVDYGKLTPLLAKGIQDLNSKVLGIQTQVDSLKSSQSATSVDVLAELAKANAITMNGDLTVNGKVYVKGTLELKGDNKGVVTVPAGQTKIHISFVKGFSDAPSVTATPKNLSKASFAVQNESPTGFDIVIDTAQNEDLLFNYQAF
jgi:hypothetical protein